MANALQARRTTNLDSINRAVINGLNRTLASRRFTDLLVQADTTRCVWKYLRDITDDHKEGVFEYRYEVHDSIGRKTGMILVYKVNVLTRRSTIIQYKLSRERYRRQYLTSSDTSGPYHSVSYYETVKQFIDSQACQSFKASFKSIFHTIPADTDLFNTDHVFGSLCGYSSNSPKEMSQIDALVRNRDKAGLLAWVQSANTEKQFCGIIGLYRLGISLTEEELRMINYVLNKNGTMLTCNGCIYLTEDISSVAMRLRSQYGH